MALGASSVRFKDSICGRDGTSAPARCCKRSQEKTMERSRRWGVRGGVVCAMLFVMAVGVTSASAQTFRGSILGTVTDTSGATVSGATVTVHNVDTGIDRSTETTT